MRFKIYLFVAEKWRIFVVVFKFWATRYMNTLCMSVLTLLATCLIACLLLERFFYSSYLLKWLKFVLLFICFLFTSVTCFRSRKFLRSFFTLNFFFRSSVLIFIQHFYLLLTSIPHSAYTAQLRWILLLCFMSSFSLVYDLITFNLRTHTRNDSSHLLFMKNKMAIIGLSIFWQLNNKLHDFGSIVWAMKLTFGLQ